MFRIAIVGAGPAGLCVASIVSKSVAAERCAISVFERDDRDRDQGAGWDVDAGGRETLTRAGVDVASISRANSDTFRLFKAGDLRQPFLSMELPGFLARFHRPSLETNRHAMRDALLAQLGDSVAVRFAVPVVDATPAPDGRAELVTAAGDSVGCFDLVVDASGVSSALRRRRVVEDKLASYDGITMLHGVINCPDDSVDAALVRALGEGTASFLGPGPAGQPGCRSIFLQRFGASAADRRTTFGTMLLRPDIGSLSAELALPPSTRFISERQQPEHLQRVKQFIKQQLSSWPAEFRGCVDAVESVALRPLFNFPARPTFVDDQLPLVCIGDALHAVPPYTGSGGNMALRDAGELATFLSQQLTGDAARLPLAQLRAVERRMQEKAAPVHEAGRSVRDMYAFLLSSADYDKLSIPYLCKGASPRWTLPRAGTAIALSTLAYLQRWNPLPPL